MCEFLPGIRPQFLLGGLSSALVQFGLFVVFSIIPLVWETIQAEYPGFVLGRSNCTDHFA